MTSNEFFKILCGFKETTRGMDMAINAWSRGIRENSEFPILTDSMWEQDVADFLRMIEESGYKKFGYYARSTGAVENIVCFTKAGWEITGTVTFDEYHHYEGLVFEKKD